MTNDPVLDARTIAAEWIAAGLNTVGVRLPSPTLAFIAAAAMAALIEAGWQPPGDVTEDVPLLPGEAFHEWKVIGMPGAPYPPYSHVWSAEMRGSVDSPGDRAAGFVWSVRARGSWEDGPHLLHRTVFRSGWQPVVLDGPPPRGMRIDAAAEWITMLMRADTPGPLALADPAWPWRDIGREVRQMAILAALGSSGPAKGTS